MDTALRVAESPPEYDLPNGGPPGTRHAPRSSAASPDAPPPSTPVSEIEGLLTLKGLGGVGDRTVLELIDTFGSAEAALAAPPGRFMRIAGPSAVESRSDPSVCRRARKAVRDARLRGLAILTLHDPLYPDRFRELHDPPSVLFGAGALDMLAHDGVAIVGARRATEAGRWMANRLGAELARAGVTVVSGLAMGIDAAAHRGALSASDLTLAVLGGGADRASPRLNEKLYRNIRARGLVLSEFFPGEPPKPYHFPKRNRLLAALARAVVVVEAAEKSGALITVDHALDLGRDVYAVPGSVRSNQSRGTNALIRDGARPLLDPAQLLADLGLEQDDPSRRHRRIGPAPEDGEDYRLWSALAAEPVHIDRIAGIAGVDTPRALVGLTRLEVQGWATQSPGMRFARGQDTASS